MINITSKGRYALKIMLDLASHENDGIQHRLGIADRQGIPRDYIDQILARLRAGKLVASTRGRNGGFTLARPTLDISVWDIFFAVEDHVYPVECLDTAECEIVQCCGTKLVWEELFHDLETNLKAKKLSDIVETWKKRPYDGMISDNAQTRDCKAPRKK